MSENIKKILRTVKSKIEAHKKFKAAYNKQLAFDFSLFNFFGVGENKLSDILAFFLNPEASHGQGDAFLKEFIEQFVDEELEMEIGSNPEIKTEKTITNNRRIDIFIKLKDNKIIAIENKIWADDQLSQLKDYAEYLRKASNDNFLLLYLTPYGTEPKPKSLESTRRQELIKKKQYKEIKHSDDILKLVNRWIGVCEADNVTYFLKAFKKYLTRKFIGKNDLNMSKELGEIIKNNLEEVQVLVDEYKKIEIEIKAKIDTLGEKLDKAAFVMPNEIKVGKKGEKGSFTDVDYYYRRSVSKENNVIFIHFYKPPNQLELRISHYHGKKNDDEFKYTTEDLIKKRHPIDDYDTAKEDNLIDTFKAEVEKACEILDKYKKTN